MGRAKELVMRVIPSSVANPFIRAHHYSGKVVNNSKLHFGVFLDGTLHGVMSYGPSLDKSKIIGLVEGTGWNEFLELNRMAFDSVLPRNSESRAISMSIKLIRKYAPQVKWMHSTSGDGELMLSLLASFAQEESRSVSENCKWRIRDKFKAGISSTTKIMGYHMDHGRITIIPDEAETVKLIFALRRLGYGRLAICKELNAHGIPAKFGGEWVEGSITKILRNEKYVGDLLLQKQFRVDHLEKKDKKNEGELPQYFIQDNHEAIIPRAEFDTVQADIKRRAAALPAGHGRHIAYPFSKKLLCAHCGKNYRRRCNSGIIAWSCATFMTYGRDKCSARQVRESILEECAARALGIPAFDPAAFEDQVDHITVCDERKLIFTFRDGTTEEITWQEPSRADSWTPEMRARAAEKKRRGSHE